MCISEGFKQAFWGVGGCVQLPHASEVEGRDSSITALLHMGMSALQWPPSSLGWHKWNCLQTPFVTDYVHFLLPTPCTVPPTSTPFRGQTVILDCGLSRSFSVWLQHFRVSLSIIHADWRDPAEYWQNFRECRRSKKTVQHHPVCPYPWTKWVGRHPKSEMWTAMFMGPPSTLRVDVCRLFSLP